MTFTANITKRERKRRLKSGAAILQVRHVLNYRDPRTGQRRQLFFERLKDAQAKRNELIAAFETGLSPEARSSLTVVKIVSHWLDNRSSEVKPRTFKGYQLTARYITGPLLLGSADDRRLYTEKGILPENAKFAETLGPVRIAALTTASIRAWHKMLARAVGAYSANRAKMFLNAALALAAEDFQIRVPLMPKARRAGLKQKKRVLTPDLVRVLLAKAREDRQRGPYYAFPFLTGVRISEQLALLWEDVDFGAGVIHICRMQELDGSITNLTKTQAGMRDIPLSPSLRTMLLEWKLLCPRLQGKLHRVFPGPGRLESWPLLRTGGGGPLLYHNFRNRFWKPAFKRLGLPYVTPHSARHLFISTMQAKGIEVGLVAKLAGHADPAVTLSHYTQAVRGGEAAMEALEDAFAAGTTG